MPKFFPFILIFSILALVSCKIDKSEIIPTFTVEISNFEDILEIKGMVEPVHVHAINAPPRIDGKVIYLIKDGTYVEEGDVVCIIEDTERSQNYENFKSNIEIHEADLELQYAMLEA